MQAHERCKDFRENTTRRCGDFPGNAACPCTVGDVRTLLSKNMFQEFIGTAILSVKLAVSVSFNLITAQHQ